MDLSSGKRIGEVLPFGTEGVRWKALAVLSHAKPGVDPVVGAVAEVPDENVRYPPPLPAVPVQVQARHALLG